MKIHHNTRKKAKAHGLVIVQAVDFGDYGVFRANFKSGDAALAQAADPKDALDLAILALQGEKPKKVPKPRKAKSARKAKRANDDAEDGEEEDDEPETRSIVKAKYRDKYRPHKMTCGDKLAAQVREAFMTDKDPDTKKPRLDFERFVRFAKANGCWVEGYRSLKTRHGERNNGLIRMNVVNRLRGKVRKDKDYKIEWEV